MKVFNTKSSKVDTIFIGMDVHKDSYTVCCYAMGEKNAWGTTKLNADYKEVLRYIDSAKAYYDLNALLSHNFSEQLKVLIFNGFSPSVKTENRYFAKNP